MSYRIMGSKHGDVTMESITGRGKTKWLKKYAILNTERKMLILSDKKSLDDVTSASDSTRSIVLNAEVKCIPTKSERKKFKGGKFLLKIMSSEGGETKDTESEVTLAVKTEENRDDWVKEINGVISKRESALTPDVITLEDLDAVKVETNALSHLNKTRPKFQGRRRPQKRPRRMLEDIDENAEKKQKTGNAIDSPVRSDVTDGASSSGLGLDSEADVTSKGPSTSGSREFLDGPENSHGRKYKRKGKKQHGASPSPVHGEVRRRNKVDRSTSLLKRLSNRLSQVFGHGSTSETETPEGTSRPGSSNDRRPSEDSLAVSVDSSMTGRGDPDGVLAQITTNAQKLLDLTKSLSDDMKRGAKSGDVVQTNLKYIRLAMKHLEKSLQNLSLVEKTGDAPEE